MVLENKVLNIFRSQFFFFTNWVFVLIILYPWTKKWFNLFFLSLLVFIGGTYFFYVQPGNLIFIYNYEVVSIEKNKKNIIHIVFHLLPFLFVIVNFLPTNFKDYYDYRFSNSLIFVLLYVFFINTKQLYFGELQSVCMISVLSFIIYTTISILFIQK